MLCRVLWSGILQASRIDGDVARSPFPSFGYPSADNADALGNWCLAYTVARKTEESNHQSELLDVKAPEMDRGKSGEILPVLPYRAEGVKSRKKVEALIP